MALALLASCGRGFTLGGGGTGGGAAAGGSGGECPPNAVRRTVCVECGPTDACLRREDICAELCQLSTQCTGLDTCLNGACQPRPCG